jgi:hypothetical protein
VSERKSRSPIPPPTPHVQTKHTTKKPTNISISRLQIRKKEEEEAKMWFVAAITTFHN